MIIFSKYTLNCRFRSVLIVKRGPVSYVIDSYDIYIGWFYMNEQYESDSLKHKSFVLQCNNFILPLTALQFVQQWYLSLSVLKELFSPKRFHKEVPSSNIYHSTWLTHSPCIVVETVVFSLYTQLPRRQRFINNGKVIIE